MRSKRTIAALLVSFALFLILTPALPVSAATQPAIDNIVVENCWSAIGTLKHTENVIDAFFENTIRLTFYEEMLVYKESNIDEANGDNINSGLGREENGNVYEVYKNDNTLGYDNLIMSFEFRGNENCENAVLSWAWTVIDNAGAHNDPSDSMLLSVYLESEDENRILGLSLAVRESTGDGWHYYENDITENMAIDQPLKLFFRTELLDDNDVGNINMVVFYDNIKLTARYNGSSDNVVYGNENDLDYGLENLTFTENSILWSAAENINLGVEENLCVRADNAVNVDFTWYPLWVGTEFASLVISGVANTPNSTSSSGIAFTQTLRVATEENFEYNYRIPVMIDNVSTVQTSASHQIGTSENVEFTASFDIHTYDLLDNLRIRVHLPDGNALSAAVGSITAHNPLTNDGDVENLRFYVSPGYTQDNHIDILYAVNPATFSSSGLSVSGVNTYTYTWTFTNPASSHVIENSKFTATVSELPNRVLGTDVVTWGGTALSASQYSTSGTTLTVDPDLNPGDTVFTLVFDRQHTMYSLPPAYYIPPTPPVVPLAEVPEAPEEVPPAVVPDWMIAAGIIAAVVAVAFILSRRR